VYGGTAIALRLGHRQSADFDFFHSEQLVTLLRVSVCMHNIYQKQTDPFCGSLN
jgi:hypothetical protein